MPRAGPARQINAGSKSGNENPRNSAPAEPKTHQYCGS
jgi:hypothetical protein